MVNVPRSFGSFDRRNFDNPARLDCVESLHRDWKTLCIDKHRHAEDLAWTILTIRASNFSKMYSPDNDSYAILGVSRHCDTRSINRAYGALVSLCHPDKLPDCCRAEGQELLDRIQNACESLRNRSTRNKYDASRDIYFLEMFEREKSTRTNYERKVSLQLTIWSKEDKRMGMFLAARAKWQNDEREKHEGKLRKQCEQEKRREARDPKGKQSLDAKHLWMLKKLNEHLMERERQFHAWEAQEKEKRNLEVVEREVETRDMQERHDKDHKDLAERHKDNGHISHKEEESKDITFLGSNDTGFQALR